MFGFLFHRNSKSQNREKFAPEKISGNSVGGVLLEWRNKAFAYDDEILLLVMTIVSKSKDDSWQYLALRKLGVEFSEPIGVQGERERTEEKFYFLKRLIAVFLKCNRTFTSLLNSRRDTVYHFKHGQKSDELSLEELSLELAKVKDQQITSHEGETESSNGGISEFSQKLSLKVYSEKLQRFFEFSATLQSQEENVTATGLDKNKPEETESSEGKIKVSSNRIRKSTKKTQLEEYSERLEKFKEFLSALLIRETSFTYTRLGEANEFLSLTKAWYEGLYKKYHEISNLPVHDVFVYNLKGSPPKFTVPLDPNFYDSVLSKIYAILVAEDILQPPKEGTTLETSLFEDNERVRTFFRVMFYYTIAYFARYLITELWSALVGCDSVLKKPEYVRLIRQSLNVLNKASKLIKAEIDSVYGEDIENLLKSVSEEFVGRSECREQRWKKYKGVFGVFAYFDELLQHFPESSDLHA